MNPSLEVSKMAIRCLFIGLSIVLLFVGCHQNAPRSFVPDRAEFLMAAQLERIQTFQQLLYAGQDIEFMLVILDQASANPAQQALALPEELALGRNTAGAKGVLLLDRVKDPELDQELQAAEV